MGYESSVTAAEGKKVRVVPRVFFCLAGACVCVCANQGSRFEVAWEGLGEKFFK